MTITATSLKLPKELKSRIARLAKESGESPHALMVRLLEEQVGTAERFRQFVADARRADARMHAEGTGYLADEVHGYLEAKAGGKPATRPQPVRWRR